jgi:hypothetical protein
MWHEMLVAPSRGFKNGGTAVLRNYLSLTAGLCLSLSLIACATTLACAQSKQFLWSYKGSVVYLVTEGQIRKFLYKQPAPDAGVSPGDVLFEGQLFDNQYQGTAFRYDSRCAKFPYRVRGLIRNGGRPVELRGWAPLIGNECRIIGYTNDVLVLQPIERTAAPNSNVEIVSAPEQNEESQIHDQTNTELCARALNTQRSGWNRDGLYSFYVAEAASRRLSVNDCRKELDQSSNTKSDKIASQQTPSVAFADEDDSPVSIYFFITLIIAGTFYHVMKRSRGAWKLFETHQRNIRVRFGKSGIVIRYISGEIIKYTIRLSDYRARAKVIDGAITCAIHTPKYGSRIKLIGSTIAEWAARLTKYRTGVRSIADGPWIIELGERDNPRLIKKNPMPSLFDGSSTTLDARANFSSHIKIQFDKLTTDQRNALDQTITWINFLAGNKAFEPGKVAANESGYVIEVSRSQDSPIWARMRIRVELIIEKDANNNRTLAKDSNILAECVATHPVNPNHLELNEEWPLTLSGLNAARHRSKELLARHNEWNVEFTRRYRVLRFVLSSLSPTASR